MSDISLNNKRIAKNTIFLYIRMFLTMLVGLYTSRVVLQTLGVSDYGIYNVVGGFVTMLSFLSTTMSNATQRFLAFEIGRGDIDALKKVFSNALTLHLLIGCIILIIAETIGLWFVINQMNIPTDRAAAAFWVYQFSVLTFVLSVFQVPFMSSIISHEKMEIYAYMSIYDVTFKLLIVFIVQIASYDKLIIYAALVCVVQITSVIIYNIYTQKKFEECRLRISCDKVIMKEMLSFSGWSIIGLFGYTANGQGLNIILNIFFGTVVNAARAIAYQVNAVVVSFSRNFQIASNPQIISLYAEGKTKEMSTLVNRTSKLSAFLLLFLILPIFFNIEYLLNLWLGDVPTHTPTFVRIVLLQSLVQSMSGPVVTATMAAGKLKMPNITGGVAVVLALPICYVALKLGCMPELVFVINIVPWFFECYFDAFYAQKYANFEMKRFYREVYWKVFIVSLLLFISLWILSGLISLSGFKYFIINCILCICISCPVIFYVGLNKKERDSIISILSNKITNLMSSRKL